MGANQRELNHCLTIHVDIEGSVTLMQGMSQRGVMQEEPHPPRASQGGGGAHTTTRPVRRSPRLGARQNGGRYETISPSPEEVRAFDALLQANMAQPGKYDSSIHTTNIQYM